MGGGRGHLHGASSPSGAGHLGRFEVDELHGIARQIWKVGKGRGFAHAHKEYDCYSPARASTGVPLFNCGVLCGVMRVTGVGYQGCAHQRLRLACGQVGWAELVIRASWVLWRSWACQVVVLVELGIGLLHQQHLRSKRAPSRMWAGLVCVCGGLGWVGVVVVGVFQCFSPDPDLWSRVTTEDGPCVCLCCVYVCICV